ncbi:flagellar basal body P-ring formation chaperone FlgA [Aestuariivirga sp.]|uniref:flagellar basal body P-ring formation chaperone FlgA n=1 Tax=Aestuariivirga sp. TaxID=2650926 RepID=UPI0025C5C1EA|nr:flagellar basal body P-ring formation chaperone FlgA [Aestuariivirga sp.]MCA3554237.1 flagellar basal body P-ring formation protein FlgA [Aestuariivirga sp.]
MTLLRLLAKGLAICAVAGSACAAGDGTTVRALPVPRETMFPGDVITADRLTDRQFQTTEQSVRGIATSSSEVIGKETRRRLVAGMPIALGGLGTPLAIRRGAAAVAVYRDEGFSISTSVIALSDGAEGDVIDARALETGAVIKVQVLPDGALAVLGE